MNKDAEETSKQNAQKSAEIDPDNWNHFKPIPSRPSSPWGGLRDGGDESFTRNPDNSDAQDNNDDS